MLSRRTLFPVLAGIPFSGKPSDQVPSATETRLLFGGDVMLSRFVERLAREKHDPGWPLHNLAPVLDAADIAFVNLEAPFSDHGPPVEHGMAFKAEPEMIQALEIAGIDVVSTANNHARDAGRHGVEYTFDWLTQHGIAPVGSGKTPEEAHAGVVLVRNSVRFGFLAYTYDQSNGNYTNFDDRIATMDLPRLRQDLASLLTRADVAIVSMHAGTEYAPRPNARQREFAYAAIDAGAHVVVGHHPHVTQPWERRGHGVIFFSLGNLVFDQVQRMETQHGLLAEVVFSGKVLARAQVLPVDIVLTVPQLASGAYHLTK